jgi:hypothetical protein
VQLDKSFKAGVRHSWKEDKNHAQNEQTEDKSLWQACYPQTQGEKDEHTSLPNKRILVCLIHLQQEPIPMLAVYIETEDTTSQAVFSAGSKRSSVDTDAHVMKHSY